MARRGLATLSAKKKKWKKWKKSQTTTWDVWKLVYINNGINYLWNGAGFQPSTVVQQRNNNLLGESVNRRRLVRQNICSRQVRLPQVSGWTLTHRMHVWYIIFTYIYHTNHPNMGEHCETRGYLLILLMFCTCDGVKNNILIHSSQGVYEMARLAFLMQVGNCSNSKRTKHAGARF